jgi:Tfp pilus assembly PilM family ATPase
MTALTPEPTREPAPGASAEDAGMAAMAAAIRKEESGGTTVAAAAPAQAVKRQAAPAPAAYEHPEPDLTEPLESLTDEIAMCLRYHASLFPGRKVERAIFVGGESRQIALCQHIARVLRLPARVADPLAQVARTGNEPCVGVDLGTPQPGWAVAYGLSLCPADL